MRQNTIEVSVHVYRQFRNSMKPTTRCRFASHGAESRSISTRNVVDCVRADARGNSPCGPLVQRVKAMWVRGSVAHRGSRPRRERRPGSAIQRVIHHEPTCVRGVVVAGRLKSRSPTAPSKGGTAPHARCAAGRPRRPTQPIKDRRCIPSPCQDTDEGSQRPHCYRRGFDYYSTRYRSAGQGGYCSTVWMTSNPSNSG
jgi:hypothetical protein